MSSHKYTTKQLIEELQKVYISNNSIIPMEKEWINFSTINSSTIIRRFGKWSDAWKAIGLCIKEQSAKNKKKEILNDFKLAYSKYNNITSNYELLKLSGHRIISVQKYFGSLDAFLNYAKIDARKRILKEDVIEEYLRIYKIVSRPPTKKDINIHSKYKLFVFNTFFNSLDELMVHIKDTYTPNITTKELIDDLKYIKKITNITPTIKDINKYSKFSEITYYRYFGGIKNALKAAGIKSSGSKNKVQCSDCGANVVSLTRHFKNNHPEILQREQQKIVDLYLEGMSVYKIALNNDVVFDSPSIISKIVVKYVSPEERKKLRKIKISNSMKDNYSSGKMKRVKEINVLKNTNIKVKKSISSGLKKAYNNGTKKSWNKGQTKSNNITIKQSAEKTSATIKNLYNSGQIERKNTGSTKRYRLGAGFTAHDKRKLKQRAKYRCEICFISQEELEEHGKYLECDHIFPIYKGCTDDWQNNGQVLCPKCHKIKTNNGDFYTIDKLDIENRLDCPLDNVLV